jgi:hypothetical protein
MLCCCYCCQAAVQRQQCSSCLGPAELSAAVCCAANPYARCTIVRWFSVCCCCYPWLLLLSLTGVAGTAPASGLPVQSSELELFETHPGHPVVCAAACAWGKAVMLDGPRHPLEASRSGLSSCATHSTGPTGPSVGHVVCPHITTWGQQ